MTDARASEIIKTRSRQETQLTFLLTPKQLASIESTTFIRKPALSFCGVHQSVMTYYDGASRPLESNGICLWVQESDGRFHQHLAVPLRDIGVAKLSRNWVNPLPTDTPFLSAIGNQVDKALLQDCLGEGLERILRRKADVSVYRLVTEKGTQIRVDIASAKSTVGKRTFTERELTLTLESGRKQELFECAQQLHEELGLPLAAPERTGVFRRAVAGRGARNYKAGKLSLAKDTTVEDALAHVVQHCLSHLRENEACVLESEDPEGVHQLRVALRRLRSALRIFRPVLPAEHHRWLNTESRYLAGRMADLRDLDVFLHEIVEPPALHYPENGTFENLKLYIERNREACRHAARDAIIDKRYADYLLNLSSWLARCGWREQMVSKNSAKLFAPIKPFAVATLNKAHSDVFAAGEKFAELSVLERHDMRIKVKRLRYASDFFSSLFPRKAVANYSLHLAELQESLGYLNDVAVAEELVERICATVAQKDALECRAAGGVVIGWHSHAMAESEERLSTSVRDFVATRPYWKKQK